jgi:hypothetical protein
MENKRRQQGRKGRKSEQTGSSPGDDQAAAIREHVRKMSSPGDDQAAAIREHVRKMMLKLRELKER